MRNNKILTDIVDHITFTAIIRIYGVQFNAVTSRMSSCATKEYYTIKQSIKFGTMYVKF